MAKDSELIRCNLPVYFFFGFEETPSLKTYFVGSDERVKPRLSQTLTRDLRSDSNSRPAVQISSPLLSRHGPRSLLLIIKSQDNLS